MKIYLETPRLILRDWQVGDKEPFFKLNSDPEVMHFFPAPLTREESDRLISKNAEFISKNGFGLFAAEEKETQSFSGFIGLNVPTFDAHFTPCVEIGWRLDKAYWNRGLATEGARAVLAYAFDELKKSEVVSFTSKLNLPSIRVMEKIGMVTDPNEDFRHPRLAADHRLSEHGLYRRTLEQHRQSQNMYHEKEIPSTIRDVGFEFSWDNQKVWALSVPVEEMAVSELVWGLDLPFLWHGGGIYNLTPRAVIETPHLYPDESRRMLAADTAFPIDVMFNKGQWVILDGLHRLMKQVSQGVSSVKVRKIPREAIPNILKSPPG